MNIFSERNGKIMLFGFVLTSFTLFVLLFLKYNLSGMSVFKDFSLNIGNTLILSIYSFFVIGFGIVFFFKREVITVQLSISFLVLSIISFLAILTALIITKFDLDFSGDYFIRYPARKVVIGIMFTIAASSLIYLTSLFWTKIFNGNSVPFLRALVGTVFSIIILLVMALLFNLTANYGKLNKKEGRNGLGVVLGAAVWHNDQPSPIFKGRIEKAYQLYRDGEITKIQLTGSNAPGEMTEAKSAYNYLISMGMPKKGLRIEEKTTTTLEQIRYIRNHLSTDRRHKIILISDQFHLTRILAMCDFYGVDALGISSDYKLQWDKLLYYRIRESIALLLFWFFAI